MTVCCAMLGCAIKLNLTWHTSRYARNRVLYGDTAKAAIYWSQHRNQAIISDSRATAWSRRTATAYLSNLGAATLPYERIGRSSTLCILSSILLEQALSPFQPAALKMNKMHPSAYSEDCSAKTISARCEMYALRLP